MSEAVYDVVIVGAGIAGAIVARTLVAAGKSVLVLEAGLSAGMDFDKAADTYQGYLDTFYKASAKVPNAPYPDLPVAPSPSVMDVSQIAPGAVDTQGYFVQRGPLPFPSDYIRVGGGATMHWLGTCLRMLPNDFSMASTYGHGVDWPIDYATLRPYYEMAEREIGVSGEVSEQVLPGAGPDYWGEGYALPMQKLPQSYLDQVVDRRVGGMEVEVEQNRYTMRLTSTPQGRNSIPNPTYRRSEPAWNPTTGRLEVSPNGAAPYRPVGAIWDENIGERCEGNASCVPICPVMAKYNALKTFKVARQKGAVVQTQAVAKKVNIDPISGRVSSITWQRYDDPNGGTATTQEAKGRVYVLATNAIENARLLLASEACKNSPQLGRNLMDHSVFLTWGLLPEKAWPFRGPGSTSNFPTFRDGEFRKDFAAFIAPIDNGGWAWPTFAPDSDVSNAVNQDNLFGRRLRQRMGDRIPRQLLLHWEVEQPPLFDNRVSVDPQYRDALGNLRPVIDFQITDYTKRSFEVATAITNQMFARGDIRNASAYSPGNAEYVTYKGVGYSFNGAGHLVGTHRMGRSIADSVVDAEQRTWEHKNLFLVGCGNMPTIGTSNPTLTMSALAFAAAETILGDLQS
jgi:choline dehydrogenase-like flavoprotein